MGRRIKKGVKKVGLPPGSLVHVGEKHTHPVLITLIDYDETQAQEVVVSETEACRSYLDSKTVTWIHVNGIHQVELIQKLGDVIGLHPLVMEDIVSTVQRPKMEDHDNYLFIVLKMLTYDNENNWVHAEQLSLVVGANYVVSFQEEPNDAFSTVREYLRKGRGKARKLGSDYLAHALIDTVVDNYFVILEKIGDQVEGIEEELIRNASSSTIRTIHNLKREVIFLRKTVWPLRELVNGMQRGDTKLIKESTLPYLQNVYDHTMQVLDSIESYRDILSSLLDIYLTTINYRMNSIMKVLTIIATLFIPLTFIASIYGMNFKFMPELDSPLGYPMVLLFMLGTSLGMMEYFRRKRWL